MQTWCKHIWQAIINTTSVFNSVWHVHVFSQCPSVANNFQRPESIIRCLFNKKNNNNSSATHQQINAVNQQQLSYHYSFVITHVSNVKARAVFRVSQAHTAAGSRSACKVGKFFLTLNSWLIKFHFAKRQRNCLQVKESTDSCHKKTSGQWWKLASSYRVRGVREYNAVGLEVLPIQQYTVRASSRQARSRTRTVRRRQTVFNRFIHSIHSRVLTPAVPTLSSARPCRRVLGPTAGGGGRYFTTNSQPSDSHTYTRTERERERERERAPGRLVVTARCL